MSEYIDDVFDGLKSVSTFSEDLAMLSEAFEVTGNDRLAMELAGIAQGLRDVEERIRRAVATDVSAIAGGTPKPANQ